MEQISLKQLVEQVEMRMREMHYASNTIVMIRKYWRELMHLLEAGVNIIYIRDILGHVDVSTTEVYARASMAMKQAALQKVSTISAVDIPSWATDSDLLDWLESFNKSLR